MGGHGGLEPCLEVLRRILLEGPWGLPPPVLRNLSLENCKFISQKGPWAEMASKRTNHFLQSLTELGLGGVTGGGGVSFRLCPALCLSAAYPRLWAKKDGARRGPPRAQMGDHSSSVGLLPGTSP